MMINPYLNDILSQASALLPAIVQMIAACRSGNLPKMIAGQTFSRIILTGMGSSYWALYPLYQRLLAAGRDAWLVETSELIYYTSVLLKRGQTLVVAASQSGASAEIVRLVEICRSQCNLIGLTNEPGSPLGSRSTAALVYGVGHEASVSCKTYLASLASQALIGDLILRQPLCSDALEQAARSTSFYLASWQAHVQQFKEVLFGVRQIYLTGRGASLAAAGTGGLIIKEANRVPAEGMSSAGFRHGPLEMIGPETFVLVFAGTTPTLDLNACLVQEINDRGGRAGLVQFGSKEDAFTFSQIADVALPMLEILPVQMMTLALGELLDHPIGVLHYSSKITTTE
jgi:glucosamine--fructose-6-phosphate aminotransferase (isomerizing)